MSRRNEHLRIYGWRHSFVVGLFLAAPALFSQQDKSQILLQETPLTKQDNGVSGRLQLMVDARLSPDLRQQMWGYGDWPFVLSSNNPLFTSFTASPPRNADLRIVDAQGHVLVSESLERPLARIGPKGSKDDGKTLFITVDYSVGWGSYAGLTTFLLRIDGAKFQWVQATDVRAKQTEKISLVKTLKSDWKFSPFGTSQDILSFYCRPAEVGEDDFVLHYVRYHFDRTRGWLKYERVRKGFWESDQPFPPRTDFP
jgi:hypothetical protein